ncbi:EAL domain-containing protein [Teichococcus aerofrigidensis]
MAIRLQPTTGDGIPTLLVLARDLRLIELAHTVAEDLRTRPPVVVPDGHEALARLFGVSTPPRHMICEAAAAGEHLPTLLAAAADPFSPTGIVLIQEEGSPIPPAGVAVAAPRPHVVAQALRRLAAEKLQVPTDDPRELERGLERGEITVRYQPVFRIADQRPVLLEGLARWQRRDDTPLSPDAFVPLAERSGQTRALSLAVARAAFNELAPAPMRIGAALSLNLPLDVLLQRDVLGALRRLQQTSGFPPSALVLELTETTPVRDRSALRQALLRLQAAGHPVLIDDMGLEEDRAQLIELPFAGIKLDRHLVGAMPGSRRARAEVERLITLAHNRHMTVTAEGVSDSRLWRAVARAGADNAQGYAIGRPLPAQVLPAWVAARRAGARLARRPA